LGHDVTVLEIRIGCEKYAPCTTGHFTISQPNGFLKADGASAELQHFVAGEKGPEVFAYPDVTGTHGIEVVSGTIDVTAYRTGFTPDGTQGGRFAGHFDFTFADGTRLSSDFDTPFCRRICAR
jgi:hypothetical protein